MLRNTELQHCLYEWPYTGMHNLSLQLMVFISPLKTRKTQQRTTENQETNQTLRQQSDKSVTDIQNTWIVSTEQNMSLRAMSLFKQSAGGKIVNAVKLVNGFILLETILSSTVWIYTVFRKKHPLTFSSISPWLMCRFKQKLQWIYLRNGRFWSCRN